MGLWVCASVGLGLGLDQRFRFKMLYQRPCSLHPSSPFSLSLTSTGPSDSSRWRPQASQCGNSHVTQRPDRTIWRDGSRRKCSWLSYILHSVHWMCLDSVPGYQKNELSKKMNMILVLKSALAHCKYTRKLSSGRPRQWDMH